MIRLLLVLLLVGGVLGKEKCNIGEYPVTYPPTMKNMTIPTVDIDLDAPPAERWVHAVAPLKEEVKRLIYTFLNHSLANPSKPIGKVVKKFLDFGVEDWLIRLPAPYPEEIRSIAKAIDMDVAYVAVYQMAYELEGACTSIVAQDGKGQIWHARNLDFGLFSGWNASEPSGGGIPGEWDLTEALRPTLLNARWIKGGKVLFTSTQYAGYVGVHTGMKQGVLGISVDSRFDLNLDRYMIGWLLGLYSGEWLTFTMREILETASSYEEGLARAQSYKAIGPAYIIMSGVKAGEGAVVTRAPDTTKALNLWLLGDEIKAGSYFVLETNYDHWKPAPIFDNRRDSPIICLKNMGQQGFDGAESLFRVLSAGPNLNRLTTFTWIINAATGHLESYKQRCYGNHKGGGGPGSGTWGLGCAIW